MRSGEKDVPNQEEKLKERKEENWKEKESDLKWKVEKNTF